MARDAVEAMQIETTLPARRFTVRGWDVLRVTLGMLLLTAAALKLAGGNVSAVPQVGWIGQPWVQLAVAEWEILLGLLLLWSRFAVIAWLIAVLTFVTFAAISSYVGLIGVATCGCFGQVAASPWHAFAADLVAVLLLAVLRPTYALSRQRSFTQLRRDALAGTGNLTGIVGFLDILIVTGMLTYGSSEAAMARLRDEGLTVSPTYVDFGAGEPGQVLEATIQVRNYSGQPVQLIGGTSDCFCVTTQALPREIRPGEAVALPLQLTIPDGGKGVFVRKAFILTDSDNQRALRLSLGGRVQ